MSSAGFYLMHRGWLDHPTLGGSREPYCRRAAWAWLIERAVYQETRVTIAGRTIHLLRGQLTYSFRYLAEAWRWDLAATRRFIERLKTDTMIDTDAGTGQLLITIRNYEKYQLRPSESGTAIGTDADTETAQERHSDGTNKNELKERNEEGKRERGAGRRTRLSHDWTIPGEWRTWTEQTYPDVDVDQLAAEFHTYWLSEAGLKADWFATWRNNIHKTRGRKNATRSRADRTGRPTAHEGLFDAAAEVARRRRQAL